MNIAPIPEPISDSTPAIPTQKILLTNEQILSKYDLEVRSPDEILRFEGFEYYDRIVAKDTHLYSILNTRKMGAASFPWWLEPANESLEALEQKDFCMFALKQIEGDMKNHFKMFLEAIPKGFAISEMIFDEVQKGIWKGKVIVSKFIHHSQKLFTFKAKPTTGFNIFAKDIQTYKDVPIPAERVVHTVFDGEPPYGRPLLEKCYFYAWLKKEIGFKFWGVFLERFGGPTAIIYYPSSDPDSTLQTQALNALKDLQNETGMVLPDSFKIDFLRVAQGDISYRDLIDSCNAEMTKAVLGATQTVQEGTKGSYSLARVHDLVRHEYKLSDTSMLQNVIQFQVIKRLCDLNFSQPLYPAFVFGESMSGAAPEKEMEVV